MWVEVQKARVALCPTGSSCSGSHMTQSNHVINAERVDGELSATNADEKSTAEAANVPAGVDEDARDDVETEEEEEEDEDEEDAFVCHRRSSTQTTFCCDCDEPTEVDCNHTPEVRRENVTCVSSIDPGGCRHVICGLVVADFAPPLNLKGNMFISAFDEILCIYIIHVSRIYCIESLARTSHFNNVLKVAIIICRLYYVLLSIVSCAGQAINPKRRRVDRLNASDGGVTQTRSKPEERTND